MISTHTPLAGRDLGRSYGLLGRFRFLLTRPSRGVTLVKSRSGILDSISTHTPLAGRDALIARQSWM